MLSDARSNFCGLVPCVVVERIGAIGIRRELNLQLVASLSGVTVLTEEVGAWSKIGNGEDDGGVLGISIHIFRGTPRDVGSFSIVGVKVETAET